MKVTSAERKVSKMTWKEQEACADGA